MTYFLFFIFIAIGISLFLICYKYFKDILNPIGIFSIVWFFSIGISQLMFSEVQHSWSILTWIITLGSAFCFITGSFSYFVLVSTRRTIHKISKPVNHYSEHRLKTIIIIIFILSFLSYLFEIYKCGGIPLFSATRIGSYMNFGVRFIHYLTVSSVIVCVLIYIYKNLFPRNRPLFLNVIFTISIFILTSILASGQLLMTITGIIVVKNYINGGKLNPKDFIRFAILGILIVALLTGFIRTSSFDNTYIKRIGKPTINLPDELSFLFLPYLYISTGFENLQLQIQNQNKLYYGTETLFPLWAFSFLKGHFEFQHYITPEGFNVGTYLRNYYGDYGFCGTMIMPFLLGLIITIFYCSLRDKSTVLKILIYSLCIYSLIIVFFANAFTLPLIWYFIILFIIIDLYCRKVF